jgi:hypothetical protein
MTHDPKAAAMRQYHDRFVSAHNNTSGIWFEEVP